MSLDRVGITERIGEILAAHTTPSFTVVQGEPLALAPDGSPFVCFWYLGETEPPEGRMTLGNVMVMERFQIMCFWHRVLELGSFEALEAEIWQANRTLKAAFRDDSTLNVTANLIANASLETNTTGWTAINSAALARITTDAKYGVACGTIDCAGTNGGAQSPFNHTVGLTYTFSVWVNRTEVLEAWRIDLSGTGFIASNNLTVIPLTLGWQRVIVTGTSTATGTAVVRVINTTVGATSVIKFDGNKLELGSEATTYIEPGEEATDLDITDSQVDYGVFPLQGESAVMYRTLEFELQVKDLEAEDIEP